MDARTLESGRRLLESYYKQQRRPVAFIDESFRGSERPADFPFYLLSAVLVDWSALSNIRAGFIEFVGSDYWHTSQANKNKQYGIIEKFADHVATNSSGALVALQLDLSSDNMEIARREAMLQLAEQLSYSGCNLAVYEQRNTRGRNSSDASVFNRARKSQVLSGAITLVGSRPSIEPLLWAPDLLSWGFRQLITKRSFAYFRYFEPTTQVLDVSGLYSLNQKRPETAAALNSGPALPAPPIGAKAIRSSSKSIANTSNKLQEVLHILPKFTPPVLQPEYLRNWITNTFPN